MGLRLQSGSEWGREIAPAALGRFRSDGVDRNVSARGKRKRTPLQ
jgi:hypothetical protein